MLEMHKHLGKMGGRKDNKLERFVGIGCLVLVVISELAKMNAVSTCAKQDQNV
jgi:hypothetical protein